MSDELRLLHEALRSQPAEDEELEGDLAVEMMGDKAFDWIMGQVRGGELTAPEMVRGLRLLSRLTRQFCLPRKGELLDLMLELAQSRNADLDVRSTAAVIATGNVLIAEGLRNAFDAYGRSADDVQAQVARAVQDSLEIGITENAADFVRTFLLARHTR